MLNSIFPAATMASVLLVAIIAAFSLFIASDAQSGACYGTLGTDLPAAPEVLALCKAHNIKRIRLYNPNPSLLEALNTNSDISVITGVAREEITGIAKDPNLALSWVKSNLLQYPNVNFRYVAVGNEVAPDAEGSSIAPFIPIAMRNIHNALSTVGLGQKIKVSTALSMGVIGVSYPPSAGAFKAEYMPSFINPIVDFLSKTGSPLLINVYPYFAYINNPAYIGLDYALFTSPDVVVHDGPYEYRDLFNAMVDAVHAALDRAGGSNVEVVVAETGWPSAGGGAVTSVYNAGTYNSNLLKSVKNGTPRKPGKALETYVFDLVDENEKSPEIEKHWGIFMSNKQAKYSLSF